MISLSTVCRLIFCFKAQTQRLCILAQKLKRVWQIACQPTGQYTGRLLMGRGAITHIRFVPDHFLFVVFKVC